MIALSLMFAQVTLPPAATSVPQVAQPPLMPPQDWSRLPPLLLRRPVPQAPEAAAFIGDEVKAGHCAIEGGSLTLDLAVLASAAGQVKRIVPRAIDCPTVEQYASGILLSMARNNIDTGGAGAEGWYRTSLTFTWGP